MSRAALQTGARAGTVTLLGDYAASENIKLQIYRARPVQLKPPSAFVESITEGTEPLTQNESQRTVSVRVRIVWGAWHGEQGGAVDQRDRFVDGFYAWVEDNDHAFGANTTCTFVGVSDDPDFNASWIDGDAQPYFATEITLEGFAST